MKSGKNTMVNERLVLGTTQLGMKYGLNNVVGKPSKKEAFAILDAAYDGGIVLFDTAFAYGTSEALIGEWIHKRGLKDKVRIISKMKPHILNGYPDGTKADRIVERELKKSLKRLRVKRLDGYLLHTPSYIYLSHVVSALKKAKRKGLVQNIGVSIYNEQEALQAAELGVDYVQVPSNVLDQRLDTTNFWSIVEKNKVTVFARSPFLQGLLVMEPQKIPAHLSYARSYVEKFQSIAKRNSMTPAQAALKFSYVRSKAPHIVFGAESAAQVTENLRTVQNAQDEEWMHEVEESFRTIEHAVVNPSLWTSVKK
jgi:aryl-alcohol dehydrogenase-like predicted oxidoreductase